MKVSDYIPSALAIIAILVVWQVAVWTALIPPYVLSSPIAIWQSFLSSRINWPLQLEATVYEAMVGFIASVAVGVPIAIVMTLSTRVRQTLYPLIVIFQVLPKLALAPAFIIIFGFGDFPRILVVLTIAIFPIIVDTYTGINSLERDYVDILRSWKVSELKILLRAKLPNALPFMFNGLKVALTLAYIGAIVAEFVQGDRGIGFTVMSALSAFSIAEAFAAISLLAIVTLLSYGILLMVERQTISWYFRSRELA